MNKYLFIFFIICLDFFFLGNVSSTFSQFSRVLIFLILFISDLYTPKRTASTIFLTLVLFIISLLSFQTNIILEISSFTYMYILFSLYQNKSSLVINDKLLSNIFLLIIVSFYLQLFFMYFNTGVFSLLRGDRNHSGTILLFFLILLIRYKNHKLFWFTLPVVFLMMSRNVVFSFLLFSLLYYFKFLFKFKKITLLISLSLIVFLPLIVNYFFIYIIGDVEIGSVNDISRFVNLKDGSNVLRFKISGEQLNLLFANFSEFIFNSQTINNLTRDVAKSEMPHSSVVELIYRFGFLRVIFFFLICLNFIKTRFTFAMFISIVFAGAVIHNVYTINLFFIMFLINDNQVSKFHSVGDMLQKHKPLLIAIIPLFLIL